MSRVLAAEGLVLEAGMQDVSVGVTTPHAHVTRVKCAQTSFRVYRVHVIFDARKTTNLKEASKLLLPVPRAL